MNVREAAAYLGIATKTLYKWKRQARKNNGFLMLHGIAVRFWHRQTGAARQGKISFDKQWLDAIRSDVDPSKMPPDGKETGSNQNKLLNSKHSELSAGSKSAASEWNKSMGQSARSGLVDRSQMVC